MAYSTTILAESSLISYWQLAETTGTAAADSKGTNTGTYTGGYTLAQTAPTAQMSGAVLLNGTTGFVSIGSPANLNLNRNFSLECWVKIAAGFTGTGALISHGVNSYYLRVAYNTGSSFFVDVLQSQIGGLMRATTQLTTGTWYHIVCTIDSGGIVKVYINGVQDATTGTLTATLSVTYGVTLGHDTNGTGGSVEWLNGIISNVAIYNAALSASQVTAHWNASQNVTNIRVSQTGTLAITQGTPKARISQTGTLAVVANPAAAVPVIPATYLVKRSAAGTPPTSTLKDGELGWNRSTKQLWIGDTGTNYPVAAGQMSIVADAAGLRFVNDAATPGNSLYYGTDSSGAKGYFTLPVSSTSGIWNYDATSTTMANPGTGKIRFNNATLASTTALAINTIDQNSVDRTP